MILEIAIKCFFWFSAGLSLAVVGLIFSRTEREKYAPYDLRTRMISALLPLSIFVVSMLDLWIVSHVE